MTGLKIDISQWHGRRQFLQKSTENLAANSSFDRFLATLRFDIEIDLTLYNGCEAIFSFTMESVEELTSPYKSFKRSTNKHFKGNIKNIKFSE